MATTIDMYSPCPCGSGKKVKFCCRELVHEFQRLMQMRYGGQRQACLDRVERLLEKHPANAFLRSLQIELTYSLEQYDRGDELIQQWVKQEPDNPIPLGWSAISHAAQAMEEEDDQERRKLFRMAVRWLQRALERSSDRLFPTVAQAVLTVVKAAREENWLLPLVGHARLLPRLQGAEQEELSYEVVRLLEDEHFPVVARGWLVAQPLAVEEIPEQDSARENLLLRLQQGLYQQAEEQLTQLVQQFPDNAYLWFFLGIMRGYLGEDRRAVEAFQQAASITSCPLLRSEALVLQLTVQGLFQEGFEHVAVELPVEDAEQVLESLQSVPQLQPLPPFQRGLELKRDAPSPEEAVQPVAPPPRAAFLLTDPDLSPCNGEHGPRWGTVLLYGKETDRPARVQLFGYRWSEQESPLGWEELSRRVPELKWQEEELLVLGESPFYLWFTAIPEKDLTVPASAKVQWLQLRLRQWSRTHRLPQLEHQTLAQAAENPQSHPLVQAVLWLLETLEGDRWFLEVDLDQFRRELGLEVPEAIAVSDQEELVRISPCWYHRLQTHSFTPEMWIEALMRVATLRHRRAEWVLARACYEAEAWKQHPRLAFLIASSLFVNEPNAEEARNRILRLHQDARNHPEFDKNACARWDALLIPLHVQQGLDQLPEALRLIEHVQQVHRNEESLQQMAAQILNMIQAIQANEMQQRAGAAPGSQETPSGLWTPDQGPPAPAPGSQKLWTPD